MDGFSVRRFAYAPAAVRVARPTRLLVLAGVALFTCVPRALGEPVARGVLGDAHDHRRRRRAIERLRDHRTMCGYGRVAFAPAGVPVAG